MFLDLMKRLYDFFADILGSRSYARFFFPMIGGFFVFIFFGNIF